MPEHIHLLVSELRRESLAVGLQALKLSVARRSERGHSGKHALRFRRIYREQARREAGRIDWNPVRQAWWRDGTVAIVQLPILSRRGRRAGAGSVSLDNALEAELVQPAMP